MSRHLNFNSPFAKSFFAMFEESQKRARERIKAAGKHRCLRQEIGQMRLISPKPKLLQRFFICKKCGRPMKAPVS